MPLQSKSKLIQSIKNDKIKSALSNFFNEIELPSHMRDINYFILQYSDIELENLNWEKICEIVQSIDKKTPNNAYLNLKFVSFLLNNKLYNPDNVEYLKILINDMLELPRGCKSERLSLFTKKNINLGKDTNALEDYMICKSKSPGIFFTLLRTINDNNLRTVLLKFINQIDISISLNKNIGVFLSQYSDIELENLNWEKICEIVQSIDAKPPICSITNLKFVLFLLDNNLYNPDNAEYLKILITDLITMPHGCKNERLSLFTKKNINLGKNANDLEDFIMCKSSNSSSIFFTLLEFISDDKMRIALLKFFNKTKLTNMQSQWIRSFFSLYSDIKLEDLNWENICDIVQYIDNKPTISGVFGSINLKFISFLLNNKLYNPHNTEFLKFLINELIKIPTGCREERLIIFNKNNIDLGKDSNNSECFIVRKSNVSDKVFNLVIDTRIDNKFVFNLLDDFYNSKLYSDTLNSDTFLRKFADSYKYFSNFKDFSDFNYSVFKIQYDFFKSSKNDLKTLIRFYLFIYVKSGNMELFKQHDPIDIFFMQQQNFLKLYSEGFELVNLNSYEKVPTTNKWVIRPNGLEDYSTMTKSTTYSSINFTEIKYDYYMELSKMFFWYNTNVLKTRLCRAIYLKDFLNFIYEYKKNSINALTNGIDYKKISAIEICSYRDYISINSESASTYNSYISTVTNFLKMCEDKKLLDIESGAFDFLYSATKPKPTGGNAIPEEDLIILENHLRKLADEGDIRNNLYYIIFHLSIETEFRISQLTSLRISELEEGMKEGQFAINTITKTSNGERKKQQISIYAKRHIDIAISHTKSFRDDAIKEYDDYIFLVPPRPGKPNKDIKPITSVSFNQYLKRQCNNLGIKKYTASNLRDTHMTKAVEFGFKHGLSKSETSILTGHTNPSTTEDFYVDYKVKTFAEATYGVIIGDIDIKGNIIPQNNTTFTKEDTVDNGCGFCKENDCKIMTELGCPMCDGFVVTLDRIPYFETKIKELDIEIEDELIEHEKQHLRAIKKLYTAYLVELYKHKEEVDKNCEQMQKSL